MKEIFIVFFIVFFCWGCFYNNKKLAVSANSIEVVEVNGKALIETSKEQARKLAINDALKNAIDTVVGIYISANTVVAKSILIDEEIRANSQGYIEKYEIIEEAEKDGVYVVKIKAHVRKQDIAIRANRIENEVEKIGSPSVALQINDLKKPDFRWAENFLVGELKKDYFRVSASTSDADVIIYADVDTSFNVSEGIGGFISYLCSINGKIYSANNELIGGFSQNGAGIGINDEDARNNASINCVKKSYSVIKDYIISFYASKKILEFEIENIKSVTDLNNVINFLKNIAQVRNIYVKNYSDYKAKIDVVVYKGNWQDIYQKISKNDLFDIKSFSSYKLLAVKK